MRIMSTPTSDVVTKVVIWLVVEIVLNFVGLDDLADYSEFVFEKHSQSFISNSYAASLIVR